MSRRQRTLIEALSIRLAVARQKGRPRKAGLFNTRSSAAAAFFAAALSIGGVSEVLQSAPFSVRKDLEGVRVLRGSPGHEHVVANLEDPFTASSVYKIASFLPDRIVSEERRLFRSEWLTEEKAGEVHERISLFNDSIRKDFFSTSIPFGKLIHEKAKKYDVDPALVAAVIEQESRFRSKAVSPKGARGLMQLMPRTGRWMGAKNLHDPEQNVDAGVKYLKYLEKRFDGDLTKALAAYNAGEATVKRYNGKIPPYQETRTYVKKVMGNYERRKKELVEFQTEAEKESPQVASR